MTIPRVGAGIAVMGAIVLAALLVFGGGGGYTVNVRFLNASQLVKGNVVDIGGADAGTVKGFRITGDRQAEVEIEVDERYAPLRRGTRAVIRAAGQTSVSGRYVQLMLPAEDEAGEEIEDGGTIGIDSTTTSVDLDQFFNIFDRPTRDALRDFYKGGQRQYAGRGEQANRGLYYLSPQLRASTRLFRELRHDPPVLERFLVGSERFVSALAERRDALAELIANLNSTTRALGSEKLALADAIGRLPGFLRQANTTYVDLRATLDELDPLVTASKPVAKKLRPYLAELRPFARAAVPAAQDLQRAIRGPPGREGLLQLGRTYPALADIATRTAQRNGADRRGAFPELSEALRKSAPIVAHGRSYTPDFVGWMDDFSHTGAYDALGSFSRVQIYVNAFSVSNGVPVGSLIPLPDRAPLFKSIAKLYQLKRCPGASEEAAPDRSNVFSEAEQRELDCRESDRATGPIKP